MKIALMSVFVILTGQQTLACIGEAQITAQVSSYELTGSTACKVRINPKSITHYQRSATCPLDIYAVLKNGIEVGVRKEDTCRFEVGDTLSGVLVQYPNGTVSLDR